ncbi:hypothetical protein [Microbulbifer thermotolerans]|uniref:Uncharacterized protein n=2 Tax=Microbulbifer thermotolerans TaxID=252514 RepID=A0A143HJ27_MICTH|nr:hypothetical protein [Microbulbifer thermotolerans]AMX01718.1 hypothetical protein A3224_03190 [Microbulbifer thermotolerans]MCX2783321.1 hypothetical protein [Microbulbifer thermotolerans]MCX2801298.1 hypothetical protein [Microbulbifer thermotolerans]MCX2832392.1 hypothetical protein [Microbulbifer thermotolerans]MCX2834843.1 hypothetical protein [Microbulbifer thermotolerans]
MAPAEYLVGAESMPQSDDSFRHESSSLAAREGIRVRDSRCAVKPPIAARPISAGREIRRKPAVTLFFCRFSKTTAQARCFSISRLCC